MSNRNYTLCRRVTRSQLFPSFQLLSKARLNIMTTPLPSITPPFRSHLHSDAFQLLSTQEKQGHSEDALYEQQIKDVKEWWASPRYEGIKRPYTVEAVVSKRGSLQQVYPSSIMARKLFNLLKDRAVKGEPVHTSTSYLRMPKFSN